MPGRARSLTLACFAAAPSRLRHALSSVQLLMPLHWRQDAHFAAVVIANSLDGALLRVSLGKLSVFCRFLTQRAQFIERQLKRRQHLLKEKVQLRQFITLQFLPNLTFRICKLTVCRAALVETLDIS